MALSLQDTNVLLSQLMSPDNTIRNQAETQFQVIKQNSDVVLLTLLQVCDSY